MALHSSSLFLTYLRVEYHKINSIIWSQIWQMMSLFWQPKNCIISTKWLEQYSCTHCLTSILFGYLLRSLCDKPWVFSLIYFLLWVLSSTSGLIKLEKEYRSRWHSLGWKGILPEIWAGAEVGKAQVTSWARNWISSWSLCFHSLPVIIIFVNFCFLWKSMSQKYHT